MLMHQNRYNKQIFVQAHTHIVHKSDGSIQYIYKYNNI